MLLLPCLLPASCPACVQLWWCWNKWTSRQRQTRKGTQAFITKRKKKEKAHKKKKEYSSVDYDIVRRGGEEAEAEAKAKMRKKLGTRFPAVRRCSPHPSCSFVSSLPLIPPRLPARLPARTRA